MAGAQAQLFRGDAVTERQCAAQGTNGRGVTPCDQFSRLNGAGRPATSPATAVRGAGRAVRRGGRGVRTRWSAAHGVDAAEI